MLRNSEDSPTVLGRSNRLLPLLDLALDLSRAERAFLVGPGPQVALCRSRRPDGEASPSRQVLEAALSGPTPTLVLDGFDTEMASSSSVRRLALHSVVAAPIRDRRGIVGALVLDSRHPVENSTDTLVELAGSVATLVGLLAADQPSIEASRRPRWSPAHGQRQAWIEQVARTELPVLVQGETGSGKERVARAVHEGSRRAAGPFEAVNCAALAESLLEAELFGTVRGAYTGAARDRPGLLRSAAGGTLFLDEVGDMPATMQAKLLRVLESGRVRPVGDDREHAVDVRVVAATHRDLADAVASGSFRADLFYRLAVLEVVVPPLRRRLDDLPRLVSELAPRVEELTGVGALTVTDEAWAVLRSHRWPGNVRELQTVLARGLIRSAGAALTPEHLVQDLGRGGGDPPLRSAEYEMLREILTATGGNLSRTARRMGWSRGKLTRRMAALGLSVEMHCSLSAGSSGREDDDQSESPAESTSSDSSTFQ